MCEQVKLKCTRCGHLGVSEAENSVTCPACGCSFPVVNGVTCFVADQDYSGSFGYQWNRFARTQLDSASGKTQSSDTFLGKTGWPVAALRGKRVLDAGCGMGRFIEVCADAGADVYGVDLSTAVHAAQRNLGNRPNVHLYQADIMNLPFGDGSFDFIYSIGVLHHTPDTRAAFLSLVPLLKPGGSIAVWVYEKALERYVGGEVLRRITPRLPRRLLACICRLAVPLYWLHKAPVVGRISYYCLPTSMSPDPEERWLDTFDWYSPRYQWKHTVEEVEGWFREARLTSVVRGSFPVSVRGTRPVS